MKPDQLERIRRHGEQLLVIFPLATEKDPVKLCKKLRRIENTAHEDAEEYCNVGNDDYEDKAALSLLRVDKLLNFRKSGVTVIVNGDPRGYALKILDHYVKKHDLAIHRDWGGYGILAPEIE